MKIGIISDTHGLLRPEVIKSLEGCEAILHGGDINRQEIIDQLGKIAPVYIVRGNNDKDWADHIPMFLDFEIAGFRIYMTMATAEISDGNISVTRIDIPQKPKTVLTKSGTADLKKQIEIVMRETQKNRSPEKIADKYGFDTALTEQIARLYLTHPGVTSDGIMTKMGY